MNVSGRQGGKRVKAKNGVVYRDYMKRLIDLFVSGVALLILLPIFLFVAILVRCKLGSPIIFCQERIGKNEKKFKMFKFRSMTDLRDEHGELLPDEVRLTKFGRLLRSTSLDELPELWNIFKGDMSLVGPRPLLERYLPYYTTEERHRHDVRPGLTGLAQVSGRSFLTWEEIFKFDLEYISKISFKTDFYIFFKTFYMVIGRKDIADVTIQQTDDDGNVLVLDHEKMRKLHRPLDEERGESLCSVR